MRRTWLVAAVLVVAGASQADAAPIVFSGIPMETNGSAGLVGPTLRLTPNVNTQVGSAWTSTIQSVQLGFTSSFQFSINTPGGAGFADGFAFVLQSAGTNALGATGTPGQ